MGAAGFVGSSVVQQLNSAYDLILQTSDQFDVCDQLVLKQFLEQSQPDFVINCVGKVSGIQGNLDHPATLLMSNATSSTSVMQVCHQLRIQNLIQFASACVYPLDEIRALKPEDLNTGLIEQSSKSYAAAKLLTIEATSAFNREFGYSWTTFIPTNLYGPGDVHAGTGGHVVSSLVSRFLAARKNGDKEVVVWGDGLSLRNFLHINDLAKAVELRIRTERRVDDVINLAGKDEISIADLAKKIATITNYGGLVRFDSSKPNGARRKQLDDSYWRSSGWNPKIDLDAGLTNYLESFNA